MCALTFPSPSPPLCSCPRSSSSTPQLDSPCATEVAANVLAAVAILVSTFPFREAGSLVRRGANAVAALISPILHPGFLMSASVEQGEEVADHTPRMPAALESLVTEEDVDQFLSDLAKSPTEVEAEEAAEAAATSTDEVVSSGEVRAMSGGGSGFGGGAAAGIGAQRMPSAAAGEAEGGDWSVIHRGNTGTGTRYRMLRRNGPAPGTTDGGERGLAQFRIEALMEGVTAPQLARVQMNDMVRAQWDSSLLHGNKLAVSEPKGGSSSCADGSELAFWRMKFPMPMAPRDYLFVRRRWQTEDGAFFGVTRDATGVDGGVADALAAGVKVNGGGYRVRRIYSGQRIRAVPVSRRGAEFGADVASYEGDQRVQRAPRPASSSTSSASSSTSDTGADTGADAGTDGSLMPVTELVSIYHEDCGVPGSVIALAACRGLPAFMRSLEAAAKGPLGTGAAGGPEGCSNREGNAVRGQGHRLRRRLFGGVGGEGGKESSSKRSWRRVAGWPARLSRFSRSAARGADNAWGGWGRGAEATCPKAGCSGETAQVGREREGRFGFRQGTRRVLHKLKEGIHRTVHKTTAGHEHIHAEGRRRKLMVRAATLFAMMALKKNRAQ